MIFQPNSFYEHEPTEEIVCGECVNHWLTKTKDGTYAADEAVLEKEFRLLEDADVEPYQCDDCMKQNEAYDEEYGEY